MSKRSGSAERVVFPVPERPKKMATSPSLSHVGAAMHGQHVLLGQEVVEHREDGLLDLAGVAGAAPMSTRRLARFRRMKASEFVPSTSGMAWKAGVWRIVNFGSWVASSSGSAWMKTFRAKSECQALTVTTRTGRR